MSQLEDLLQQCTVKLSLPDRMGWGTGFFVAPEWILTCAHVVQEAKGQPVQVRWQKRELEAVVERSLPDLYDLALLRVTQPIDANPPCVYLDAAIQSRDPLYLFGYPDQDFPNGCPVTFNCEGLTGDEPALIKFALGQVRPGMSGSPLLNQRTGKVCGIVKFTRDRSIDLGGGAIPASIILSQLPGLVELQQKSHLCDRRWSALVAELSDDEMMNQTNLGGTNYQTQTGDNSTTFIGGEHYHHSSLSKMKQTVKKILMLSANPENPETSRRRKEIREIRGALSRAKYKDLFDVQDRSDTGAADLFEELLAIEPSVVDISGHESGIESLVLENISDNDTFGNSERLIAQLFEFHAQNIECIILNGCYSEKQAKAIVQYIEFVIGISQSLKDSETLEFLKAFYVCLGAERTIEDSYRAGCHSLEKKRVDNAQLPILLKKRDELRRRELEKELKACDVEIEKSQNDATLWKKKADILKDLNRPEEMTKAYEKASLLEPRNYQIRTKQGDALEEFKKHEEAIEAYDKALELEEKDYKIWWKKGQALAETQKYGEAVECYRKVIELDPPSPDNYVIHREYGSIFAKLGQYQKSVVQYKKSLALEPRYRASSYEKRRVYKKIYFG